MEFRLLGRFEAEHEGKPLVVGRRRERCLLAVLLLEAGTAVPVGRLIDLLWDETPPQEPRATIHTYVARLRAHLDPNGHGGYGVRLTHAGDGYLAEVDPDAVDALRFRSLVVQARSLEDAARRGALLREALRLWRGPMLADTASDRLRSRLVGPWQEAQLAATEAAIEAEMACGQSSEVIGELGTLISDHPHRERFTGLLMLALYRTGRQAEALDAYRYTRRTLIDQLGVEPGPELQSLHQRILAADTGLLTPPPGNEAAADAPIARAVPRQLPAASQHFTGRRTELDALTGLLEHAGGIGGTVLISAIDGMAGIGKTALAVHAAYLLAEKFPDGQIFLDLHGYTQGYPPRSALEALETSLRALGVPPRQVPQDLDECAALYRQRLADTKTLIVLDNAAHEAQVRPLLPGSADCLVLVTSRRRLKGLDDAVTLSLDVLPEADALALLRAVAGPAHAAADDQHLEEIARLCGHLPLALRIAAALLRHRPIWNLQHLAELLRDQHHRLTTLFDGERDLGGVFDLSYQGLTDDQRRLFRSVGSIPGPDFDVYAAAALTGTDPASATRLLEDLVDHNLIIPDAPGRYRLHDLLRLHARALADQEPADEHRMALDRLLDYYQYAANYADTLIATYSRSAPAGPAPAHAPNFASPDSALQWLRAERPNLLAALRHATTHADHPRVLALTAGLTALLYADGPWSEALTLHTVAAEAAGRLGDQSGQAGALTHLGQARGMTGDHQGAIHDLQDALKLYRVIGEKVGEANALTWLGQVRATTGDLSAARRDLQDALQRYRQLGDRRGQAHALTYTADLRRVTGDHRGAIRDLQIALQLYRELGNRRGQATALTQLGIALRVTGDHQDAMRHLEAALELCRDSGERLIQGYALAYLGQLREITGDHEGAIHNLQDALRLYRDLGDQLGEGTASTYLGRVRHATGDNQGAIRDLQRALNLFRNIGYRGAEAWAMNHYAAAILATRDSAHALKLYRDALDLTRQTQQRDDEALALEGIGECLLASDEINEGATHLRLALEIFQGLDMNSDAERINTRLADLDYRFRT